jgi:hypothetical protein
VRSQDDLKEAFTNHVGFLVVATCYYAGCHAHPLSIGALGALLCGHKYEPLCIHATFGSGSNDGVCLCDVSTSTATIPVTFIGRGISVGYAAPLLLFKDSAVFSTESDK